MALIKQLTILIINILEELEVRDMKQGHLKLF